MDPWPYGYHEDRTPTYGYEFDARGRYDGVQEELAEGVSPTGASVRGGTGRGGGDCRSLHAEHMKMALTKLVFTFPNSQRAQQFAGWLFLAGYIDRVVEQNTVMVEVACGKRTAMIKKAAGRGGRLM